MIFKCYKSRGLNMTYLFFFNYEIYNLMYLIAQQVGKYKTRIIDIYYYKVLNL